MRASFGVAKEILYEKAGLMFHRRVVVQGEARGRFQSEIPRDGCLRGIVESVESKRLFLHSSSHSSLTVPVLSLSVTMDRCLKPMLITWMLRERDLPSMVDTSKNKFPLHLLTLREDALAIPSSPG